MTNASNALCGAIYGGHLDLVVILVKCCQLRLGPSATQKIAAQPASYVVGCCPLRACVQSSDCRVARVVLAGARFPWKWLKEFAMIAAESGNLEMISLMLSGTDTTEALNPALRLSDFQLVGETQYPFLVALARDHLELTVALLRSSYGDRHNSADPRFTLGLPSSSSLGGLCASGDTATLRAQLSAQNEAVLNTVNCFGETPLMIASHFGNAAAVQALLARYVAAEQSQVSSPVVDVNRQDICGRTALAIAARNEALACAELLVHHPAVIWTVPNDEGQTPFWLACATGNTQMVKMLLNHAPPDPRWLNEADRTKRGYTPFHAVVLSGRVDCVDMLLSHPCVDPNAMSTTGETALMLVSRKGRRAMVGRLLQAGSGVDVTLENNAGSTAADVAHHSVVDLFHSQRRRYN
jgi:ankyrin repeat protein